MRRRWRALETATVGVAAAVAGLTVMVPIDPTVGVTQESSAWVDLAVFNVPRATLAAAFVTVLAAVCIVMASDAVGWVMVALGAGGLLVDQVLWSNEVGSQSLLTWIDSVLAGMLMGTVGTLAWHRKSTASAFLFGAMSGILVGDFTPAPAPGQTPSWLNRYLLEMPTIGLSALVMVAAALCALGLRHRPAVVRKLVDVIPLRPVVVAGIVFPTILLTSEWFAQEGRELRVLVVGTVLIVSAAVIGAFVLPGRDGVLLLLMVAFAAAGSTPVTVPRPDWAVLVFVALVGLGLAAGHRRGLPLLAAGLIALLAVGAILTALTGAHGMLVAVLSGMAVAFVGGYSLGAATPLFPSIPPLCIGVLFVPSAAVALWGRDFDRIAYSPSWYRPAEPARAIAPGLVALAITLGCAAAIALVCRVRPRTKEAIRDRWARMQADAEHPGTITFSDSSLSYLAASRRDAASWTRRSRV
ncbi:hypothetical protein LTV02_08355 [Nocardia yamanashiensis]|uniref:hypothetical protein n=1 Tax=Nocardia yamanashiensis TaxID=209247 RepID=UPI001E305FE7|nr:hypothetical protein [Nocardia yamanashiensis]UGT43384.1 hypothetical protein LTV02_08355 [Nocardia yamanashiensis]